MAELTISVIKMSENVKEWSSKIDALRDDLGDAAGRLDEVEGKFSRVEKDVRHLLDYQMIRVDDFAKIIAAVEDIRKKTDLAHVYAKQNWGRMEDMMQHHDNCEGKLKVMKECLDAYEERFDAEAEEEL
ncbi:hypothetical protein G7046_g9251 [Stylonectria norvegica]|nr:hypothetical protein G7046_g9251 [Stylonectria norvegica]